MTLEDEELLLKDLCARLPYGVMLSVTYNKYTGETFNARISTIDYCGEVKVRYGFEEYEQAFSLEEIKPYLFPLSSMTEEQRYELHDLIHNLNVLAINGEIGDWIVSSSEIDWYNKNHFDYRGLIEKGLALDATGKGIY